MCHRKGHLDTFDRIRQMMADQKLGEAEKLIEVQLALNNSSRHELLELFYEVHRSQHKQFPLNLTLELAELAVAQKNWSLVGELMEELKHLKTFRAQRIRILAAEANGKIGELHELLSQHLILRFELKLPNIPEWLNEICDRYFQNDFSINLQKLAIHLARFDLAMAETMVVSLITSCLEKSMPKKTAEKFLAISTVLRSAQHKGKLEVYQNLCLILASGVREKADLKRLVEMVILFEDFRFQTLVLQILHQNELRADAEAYARVIRTSESYDYVYLDKYFSELKPYFFTEREELTETPKPETPDLTLERKTETFKEIELDYDDDEELETLLSSQLQHQNYTSLQLCDLAVGFFQSGMPRAAQVASQLAMDSSANEGEFLKGAYLKLSALLQLKDYRAALDLCLAAFEKARTQDDVLSFLYAEAELLSKLDRPREAKRVLRKILEIDENYRLAKERFEKL
jgi:hypothetical protein